MPRRSLSGKVLPHVCLSRTKVFGLESSRRKTTLQEKRMHAQTSLYGLQQCRSAPSGYGWCVSVSSLVGSDERDLNTCRHSELNVQQHMKTFSNTSTPLIQAIRSSHILWVVCKCRITFGVRRTRPDTHIFTLERQQQTSGRPKYTNNYCNITLSDVPNMPNLEY